MRSDFNAFLAWQPKTYGAKDVMLLHPSTECCLIDNFFPDESCFVASLNPYILLHARMPRVWTPR